MRHFTQGRSPFLVRLACVRHAASVDSEPGSNSRLILVCSRPRTGVPDRPSGCSCSKRSCSLKLVRMTKPKFTSSHDWHVQLCCQRSLTRSALDGELWIKDMTGHKPQISVLELMCAVLCRMAHLGRSGPLSGAYRRLANFLRVPNILRFVKLYFASTLFSPRDANADVVGHSRAQRRMSKHHYDHKDRRALSSYLSAVAWAWNRASLSAINHHQTLGLRFTSVTGAKLCSTSLIVKQSAAFRNDHTCNFQRLAAFPRFRNRGC